MHAALRFDARTRASRPARRLRSLTWAALTIGLLPAATACQDPDSPSVPCPSGVGYIQISQGHPFSVRVVLSNASGELANEVVSPRSSSSNLKVPAGEAVSIAVFDIDRGSQIYDATESAGCEETKTITLAGASTHVVTVYPFGSAVAESEDSALSLQLIQPRAQAISCQFSTCPVDGIAPGARVEIQALPRSGAVLSGWSGPCSGTGSCAFDLTQDTAVYVQVDTIPTTQAYTRTQFAGNGRGTIQSTPAGIQCGNSGSQSSSCVASFAAGTSVSLAATPDSTSEWAGWTSGPCQGATEPVCSYTQPDSESVHTAEFRLKRYPLTVTKAGNIEQGIVTSSPAGIDCGSTCSAQFDHGTIVTLTAAPRSSQVDFVGWSGACVGTGPCRVTLQQASQVGAEFRGRDRSLSVQVNGPGRVIADPPVIQCGAGLTQCQWTIDEDAEIVLMAEPSVGAQLVRWSGDCAASGTQPSCRIRVQNAHQVSADFATRTYTVTVQDPGGSGQITGNGIQCGNGSSQCSSSIAHGDTLQLTATPGAGMSWVGWGGACSGTSTTCSFSVTQDASVSAQFAPASVTLTLSVVGNMSSGLVYVVVNGTQQMNCGMLRTCQYAAVSGASVELTADPSSPRNFFRGWSGASCTGTNLRCSFTLLSSGAITADIGRN